MIPSSKQRKQLERDNKKYPTVLTNIAIPVGLKTAPGCFRVMRSRTFLAQLFNTPSPDIIRLSVVRSAHNGKSWAEGITWDELQRLKREAGFGDNDAVECYPRRSRRGQRREHATPLYIYF
jgi:hypothetical protein